MLFDSTILSRIAADIRRQALGARVERVFQPAREEVVLELRRNLPRPQIVLSYAADLGRAHLARDAEPRPDARFPFGDVLRKHLRGATLTGAQQVSFDRMLRLDFANCEGLGPQSRATLVAEIMGRHGNLVLLDEDGRIIACSKHVSIEVNRYRETLPGLTYTPPPAFDRLAPQEATAERLESLSAEHPEATLGELMRKGLMGASDVFLEELLARAGLGSSPLPVTLSEAKGLVVASGDASPASRDQHDNCRRLSEALQDMLAEAEAEGPAFLYTSPASAPPFAYPLVLQSRADLDCTQVEDLSGALEDLAAGARTGQALRQGKERVGGLARRALQKARTREHERLRALQEAEDGEALRRQGELILANLHTIRPGVAEATVTDYYQDGQPQITLRLDPHHSAQENARALFDRYKRARRIQEKVPPLLQEARTEREYLEGVLDQSELAATPEDLLEVEAELARRGHVGRQGRKKPRPTPRGETRLARVQAGGYSVWYGRTGTQNDELVRTADGDDLWFHVKDGPGGHVVIRTGGRPDAVPEPVIRQAAAIAAGLSKWRTDSRADVNCTLVKHVRKAKGAPPGFVTYSESRTLTVEPKAA